MNGLFYPTYPTSTPKSTRKPTIHPSDEGCIVGLRVDPFCLQDVTDTIEVGKRVFCQVWTVRHIDAVNCVLCVNFIFDVTPIRS